MSSAIISVESPIGLSVRWDGNSRVYVTVEPHFRNKTCGLCGTFNSNQNDDLTTKEDVVETSVSSFGNSWKVDAGCNDTTPMRHPCELQVQRKTFAEKMCNKLLQSPFTKCHHTIDPNDGYIESCRFDVCGCQQGTSCLCSSLASYVHDCAKRGVVIEWRNAKVMPECGVVCSKRSQVYQVCGPSCNRTCKELSMDLQCKDECVEGCNCPRGMALDDGDACVPHSQCPCYQNGRRYAPGTILTPSKCTQW